MRPQRAWPPGRVRAHREHKPPEQEEPRPAAELAGVNSPGPDGLPVEYLQRFPKYLGPLLDVWNECRASKSPLPHSIMHGWISLIPKKGAPDANIDNYRPITVLPAAYRVLSRALSNRLRPTLATTVPGCQTGFVPGRHIQQNILQAQLGMRRVRLEAKLAAAMLLVDFRKAYDTIIRLFFLAVFAVLGYPRYIREALEMLGDGLAACI